MRADDLEVVRELQRIAASSAVELAQRHGRDLVFVVCVCQPDPLGQENLIGSGIGHSAALAVSPEAPQIILRGALASVGKNLPIGTSEIVD